MSTGRSGITTASTAASTTSLHYSRGGSTTPIHSALRALIRRSRRRAFHPDAVPEAQLNLPRRIDDPASAAQLTRDLLRHRREEITLALYLDDRHRLVGTAILAVGWVQATRLSGSQACRGQPASSSSAPAAGALPAPLNPRIAPFRSIAAACSRYGLVAVATGEYSST